MEWKFVEVLLCVLQFSKKNDNYLCAKNKDKIKTEKKTKNKLICNATARMGMG